MSVIQPKVVSSSSQDPLRYDASVRLVFDKFFNKTHLFIREPLQKQMMICIKSLFDLPIADDVEESRKSHLARISLHLLLCVLTKQIALARPAPLTKRTSLFLSDEDEATIREFLLITSTMMVDDGQYHHLLDEVLCLLEANACFYKHSIKNTSSDSQSFLKDFATDMIDDTLDYVSLFYPLGSDYSHFGRQHGDQGGTDSGNGTQVEVEGKEEQGNDSLSDSDASESGSGGSSGGSCYSGSSSMLS